MVTAFDGVQDLGQDNLQAAMKTFGAFTHGLQKVASEIAHYNKAAVERGTTFLQDLARAKGISDVLQVQTNYLMSSYDSFRCEIGKLSGIWKDIALEATKSPGPAAHKAKG